MTWVAVAGRRLGGRRSGLLSRVLSHRVRSSMLTGVQPPLPPGFWPPVLVPPQLDVSDGPCLT